MVPIFSKRQANLRKLMDIKRLDAIFTSDHANIQYYIGYEGMKDDRLFMLFPRHGEPTLFVSILGNEAVFKYEKTVFYTGTKEIIKRVKYFKRLGYEEKKMNVFLFNKLNKLKIKMVPVGEMMEIPRRIKDDYEIEQIRKAIKTTKKMFSGIGRDFAGLTEKQVSNKIGTEFRRNGVEESFESIVSSGLQTALIHHKPNERKIQKGDAVLIDTGCKYNGYCSDITRMFFSRLSGERKKIYDDAVQIHNDIIDNLKSGVKLDTINNIQEKFFKRNGYKMYHSFGHGVGLTVHEGVGDVLKKNMIVTVEPGIYVKNIGGFRIENMVLIKKGRSENLSKSI